MAAIKLNGVHKVFGDVHVIKGVDLDIADQEFVVFVGPSGCGKSTLLRLISGLEDVSDGTIAIGGSDVTALPASDRGLAMVFQSYALYPHMTVGENMGFGLKMAGTPKAEIDRRVGDAAEVLKLTDFLSRKPKALSGGQRQRVAIGRAIVREPRGFLFDEPLSNLDAALRVQMRIEIARLHQDLQATMIYVTHDQVEAMTLADKIVVLQGGVIEQFGSPLDLYHRPRNLFVAQFIGSPKMNVVNAAPEGDGEIRVAGHGCVRPGSEATARSGAAGHLGIRPEHIDLADPADAPIAGSILVTEHLGSDTFLYVDIGDDRVVTVRAIGEAGYRAGENIGLQPRPELCHVFDETGLSMRA